MTPCLNHIITTQWFKLNPVIYISPGWKIQNLKGNGSSMLMKLWFLLNYMRVIESKCVAFHLKTNVLLIAHSLCYHFLPRANFPTSQPKYFFTLPFSLMMSSTLSFSWQPKHPFLFRHVSLPLSHFPYFETADHSRLFWLA